MSEKIQVLGISVEKCYVDEVMDNINENWNRDDVLATYGVINMKILPCSSRKMRNLRNTSTVWIRELWMNRK